MPVEDYELRQLEVALEQLKSDHDYEIGVLQRRVKELETIVENLTTTIRRPRTLSEVSGRAFIAWPKAKPLKYNGSGEPCDMWTGPCCCGAWHEEGK
jgi:hypothetical protein